MNLLAIDTSTEQASIGVYVDGQLWQETQPAQRLHAQVILPIIERLLKQADYTMSQFDGIVFGRGPGSFTGLRIAASIAKGLAYAHNLPLYPVSSLAAIAEECLYQHHIPWGQQAVLAVVDARMQQLYWACFYQDGLNTAESVSDAADLHVPDVDSLLLAGVGYTAYRDHFPGSVADKITLEHSIYPEAAAMIRLVHAQKIRAVTAHDASPVYIRNQVTQGEARG